MSDRFNDAAEIEMLVWWMRLADFPRGEQRAKIDRLFNGKPPWEEKDVDANHVRSNMNDLTGPSYMADARRSLSRALKTSNTYFKVNVDFGPVHKRGDWSSIITTKINERMKANRLYSETLSSQIALKCLHGNGPVFWVDRDIWCPSSLAIQDVLIPSRTLRSMENLDHFAVFRQWTYEQLYKMTHGPHVDPAWQMDVVEGALKWVRDQMNAFLQSYAQWYAPQNIEEMVKENMGFMGTDAVATVDVWDFYYHSDENGHEGWRRRIILDTPMAGEISTDNGKVPRIPMPSKNGYDMDHGKWLYKPDNNRVYASKLSEILHWQFGDATASAPFRYHSIRSLGWLLYPQLHLQNRLFSKFFDHLFENLQQYFRVSNEQDHDRLVKLDLHNWGIIPDSTQFVKQDERWQINMPLLELGFGQIKNRLDQAAAQYREGRETERPSERETATAVMARVNAAAALVGSMNSDSYEEMSYQFMEVGRRYCNPKSMDKDVRKFRADVLSEGVPPEALNVERWTIEPDKILGNGNKMIAMAMVQQLMSTYQLHDPQAQREILNMHDREVLDNAPLANRLSGMDKRDVSDSVHKAMGMVGSLMQGIAPPPERGENPSEMAGTLMHAMASILQRVQQTGPTPAELIGLKTMGAAIGMYIQILAQDKEATNQAREMEKDLKLLLDQVQQMGEALAKQAQAGGNGGPSPEMAKEAAKIQGKQMMDKVKADNMSKSHSARTAQKQISWQMAERQKEQKHQNDMRIAAEKAALENQVEAAKSAFEIRRQGMKSLAE